MYPLYIYFFFLVTKTNCSWFLFMSNDVYNQVNFKVWLITKQPFNYIYKLIFIL